MSDHAAKIWGEIQIWKDILDAPGVHHINHMGVLNLLDTFERIIKYTDALAVERDALMEAFLDLAEDRDGGWGIGQHRDERMREVADKYNISHLIGKDTTS